MFVTHLWWAWGNQVSSNLNTCSEATAGIRRTRAKPVGYQAPTLFGLFFSSFLFQSANSAKFQLWMKSASRLTFTLVALPFLASSDKTRGEQKKRVYAKIHANVNREQKSCTNLIPQFTLLITRVGNAQLLQTPKRCLKLPVCPTQLHNTNCFSRIQSNQPTWNFNHKNHTSTFSSNFFITFLPSVVLYNSITPSHCE